MKNNNKVFIAQSIDGCIADRNGAIDWLNTVPNPGKIDMGYSSFIKDIDAIVMGRLTFETVCNFDMDWPYKIPVFVLSKTLKTLNTKFKHPVELMNGSLKETLSEINRRGFYHLYIDGGKTIQSFLQLDLIDEITITTIPVLLGGGSTLFSNLPTELNFKHVKTTVFLNEVVQSQYRRKR